MAKRRLAAIVKIQIPAGQATPAPPVGTALGPHGINIMDFCKAYNSATESQRGLIIPAEISIYEDRSFTFVTKTPPTPFLLRQAAGVEKGAANPRTEKVGKVTRGRCGRSPRRRCPTSTPSTSKARCSRLRAPPGRWESRSATTYGAASVPRAAAGILPPSEREGMKAQHDEARQEAHRRGERATTASACIPATEALDLVKSLATHKFDETVEAAFRLGVDPRKADQMIRGTVSLPKGTGKDVRVAVFAEGDAAREAEEAGADVVGFRRPRRADREGLPRLRRRHRHSRHDAEGRKAGPHARSAQPHAEPEGRDRQQRSRQDRRRVQGGQGRVPHRPLRERSRADRQGELRRRAICSTNYQAVLDEVLRAKPASSKGRYLKGVALSSSMGPGVHVDPTVLRDELAQTSG